MKLCFVVIVFGLSFIICNKHYIKYSACYKLPIPKTPFYPDAYKFANTKEEFLSNMKLINNAIKVFDEVLTPMGYRPKAVRIDSGDLSYISKKLRVTLDNAGYKDCKICGTNSLDEYVITSIIDEGAKLDSFGVGENLITAKSNPVFGGVYKLSAIEKEGRIIPKIKVSNNTIKITNPGFKKTYRFYDKNKVSAYLLISYLLWIIFASILNLIEIM